MTEIYERNINISVGRLNKNAIVTKASLLDLNHNMRVELTVDIDTKTITDSDAQMVKTPYEICQLTLQKIHDVIGMKIERGIHKRVVDALGHAEGCTHLVDLTMEAIRLSANVLIGFSQFSNDWKDRKLPDEEMIARVKPYLKNACLPFKE